MAKKLKDEELHLHIIINGNKAKKELGELEKANKDLRSVNKELLSEKAKLAAAGKTETQEYKRITTAISDNNKTIKENETRMAKLRKEIGLSGLTYRQLSLEAKRLKRDMDNATPGTAEWKRYKAELDAVQKQMGVARGHANNMKTAFANMMGQVRGLLPAMGIAALVAGLRRVSQITIEFSAAQSNLAAVLGKTKKEIKALTDDAARYGAITKFTAKQVTDLQTEFGKLGFTESQIRSSTRATLDFAAATNGELGAAAKVVGVSLKAFNMSAAQSERVTSAMAVATTKSALSFEDLETILSTVGPIANAYGLTLEDTLALTGKLKDAGFDASSAATATRNILLNLADSGGLLAQALGRPVRSLDELVPALVDLKERGIDVNETLQLTDKRSVAAFNAFLVAAGSTLELRDGLIGVNKQLQDMVETQLDNLAGDLTILTSAWQGFILSIERGDGVIAKFARFTIQFLTDALTKLSNVDLIFKRASKMSEEEVSRAYDAMMSLSGKKYQEFQDLVQKENDLTLAQVILRRDAMIREIRDTGQSRKEAIALWDEYYRRRKEQSINAIQVKAEEEKAAEDRAENDRKVREKEAEKKNEEAAKIAMENSLKLQKFLTESSEKMRDDIQRYFREAGDGAIDAFFESVDKKIDEKKKIKDLLDLKPEEADDVDVNYALKDFANTEQGKLNILNAAMAAGKISQQEYQDEITRITKEGEEARLAIKMKNTEDAAKMANMAANFVYSLMDLELEKAGENEEKKKEIRKKYANVQFLITTAQIVTDTAASIMKAFAELGPIAGAVAAAILGATGAVQIGIANAQRQRVQGYADGGFTPSGSWNEPKGVVHSNEFVANRFAVGNPSVRQFLDVFDVAQRNGTVRYLNTKNILNQLPVNQFANGGYTSSVSGSPSTGRSIAVSDFRIEVLLEENLKLLDKLQRWEPKVATTLVKKDLRTLDDIDKNRGM